VSKKTNSKKDFALKIFSLLKKEYPNAKIALKYSTPWQLLVATILSAQCTDERVNIITDELFKKHPDLDDYVKMNQDTLITYIRPAGFFNNKSKSILNAAKKIKEKFKGELPKTMDEMLTIPGVARKTANVVLGNIYNVSEGIAVDTHVKRLSFRFDLTNQKVPEKIEKDLMKLYPKEKWYKLTYLFIEHGRAVCKAPTPTCSNCVLNKICPKKGVTKSF
jgi:endonuclease-3